MIVPVTEPIRQLNVAVMNVIICCVVSTNNINTDVMYAKTEIVPVPLLTTHRLTGGQFPFVG